MKYCTSRWSKIGQIRRCIIRPRRLFLRVGNGVCSLLLIGWSIINFSPFVPKWTSIVAWSAFVVMHPAIVVGSYSMCPFITVECGAMLLFIELRLGMNWSSNSNCESVVTFMWSKIRIGTGHGICSTSSSCEFSDTPSTFWGGISNTKLGWFTY